MYFFNFPEAILLIFFQSENTNDNSRTRHKSGDKAAEDSGSRRRDKSLKEQPQLKRIKESRSRTTSRDRFGFFHNILFTSVFEILRIFYTFRIFIFFVCIIFYVLLPAFFLISLLKNL